ncbi:phosphoribosyltransferase-like protein [Diplogelasinospora grovesii]|uniref:adenine phosphoribosyltransferase n=1 Tax=Diplogelasinospora grovesii TaxID=303347 RepID=A0AAN6NEM2_9PEZI|nr:phosphoribosyltransferase-like protein [Diplogelasinospora grovesii]
MSPIANSAQQPLASTQDQIPLTSAEAAVLASATSTTTENAPRRQPASAASGAAELASTKISLLGALKHFPDFPIPGIDFIDILPLFQDPTIHGALLRALELQVLHFGAADGELATTKPDVIVGLDARGFLFGPSLALRLNASFVPVRKKGKMPGPCVTAAYEKEYGTDYFQMQEGAVKPGQKVLVVDDIIATGGSAAAAGSLVKKLGGELIGYLFILEIPFLKGREKLGGLPTVTLLETDH